MVRSTSRPVPASWLDSDPDREWEETLNKGRALIRAIAEASGGLHQ